MRVVYFFGRRGLYRDSAWLIFGEKPWQRRGGGGMEKIKKRIELREIIGLKEMTGVKERIRLKG